LPFFNQSGKSGNSNSVSVSWGLAEEAEELQQMPEKIKLQLFPIDEATLVGLEKVKINGMLTPPKKDFRLQKF
jgi:hypothetical protein